MSSDKIYKQEYNSTQRTKVDEHLTSPLFFNIENLFNLTIELNNRLEKVENKAAENFVRLREMEWAHEISEDSQDETQRNVTKEAQEAAHEHIYMMLDVFKSDIDKLATRYYGLLKALQSKDGDLWERVKKLEDENKMRQDTIACVDRAYDEACQEIENRLTKLESEKLANKLDPHVWVHVNNRLDELESMINKVELQCIAAIENKINKIQSHINKIEKNYQDKAVDLQAIRNNIYAMFSRIENIEKEMIREKTPHKCPVCDGEGRLLTNFNSQFATAKGCHACEGKGVL